MRSLLEKTGYAILVLWGVASLVFFLFTLLPGDPAKMMMDKREDPELLKSIRQKYGLDLPVSQQYFYYLNDLSPISCHIKEHPISSPEKGKYTGFTFLENDRSVWYFKWPYLRESFQKRGQSVTSIIGSTLPNTIILAVTAITFAILIGLLIGVLSAVWRDSLFDRFWTVFGTLGMSLPSFFTAILFAWLFGFVWSKYTGLPTTGNLWELDDFGEEMIFKWRNLILPALTLGIRPLGVIIQLSRNSMLETLSKDYIRTARAKGLNQFQVIWRHALRNSLNPVVTVVSGWFASLLAGAVFVEFIFGWNGLGKEIVNALNTMDIPLVMGAVLVIAGIFVVINIVVDFIYKWLDPRMR